MNAIKAKKIVTIFTCLSIIVTAYNIFVIALCSLETDYYCIFNKTAYNNNSSIYIALLATFGAISMAGCIAIYLLSRHIIKRHEDDNLLLRQQYFGNVAGEPLFTHPHKTTHLKRVKVDKEFKAILDL